MTDRKLRKDAGVPRIKATRKPLKVTLYLAGHGVEAKIATTLESELKRVQKDDPDANAKDVIVDWVSDFLGLKP